MRGEPDERLRTTVSLHSRLTAEDVRAARGSSAVSVMGRSGDGPVTIRVDGIIADYDGYARARDFAKALERAGGRDVLVRINSPGGSVFEGFAMYNLARSHEGGVTTRVDGLAASAASLVFMAGDERLVPREAAQVMVHEAWIFVMAASNKSGLRRMIAKYGAILDGIDAEQVKILMNRAGMSKARATSDIEAETWYDAEAAIDSGIATAYAPERKRKDDDDDGSKSRGAVDVSADGSDREFIESLALSLEDYA